VAAEDKECTRAWVRREKLVDVANNVPGTKVDYFILFFKIAFRIKL